MSDIIKFEFDQPVELALKFAEPKVFASQFAGGDDRHMFSTTDGRVMYTTPLVATKIKALGVQPGEFFFICKRKDGRLTDYTVYREGNELPAASRPTAVSSGGWSKKTFPPLKSNLPERVYYKPELSPAAESTLEQQLRASIDMVNSRKAEEQGDGTLAVMAPPAPQPRPAAQPPAPVKAAAIVKIPMDRAVIDAVRMVQAAMKECNEQWSDQARQDLVSTILIGAQREGWIQCWNRGDNAA
jgi:hypothetical protein